MMSLATYTRAAENGGETKEWSSLFVPLIILPLFQPNTTKLIFQCSSVPTDGYFTQDFIYENLSNTTSCMYSMSSSILLVFLCLILIQYQT